MSIGPKWPNSEQQLRFSQSGTNLYIIHIAAEIAPIAKVGGLADVVAGLSKELTAQGHAVEIIIPKYDCLDYSAVTDLHVIYPNLYSYYKGIWIRNTVWRCSLNDLSVLMIEPHNDTHFFGRGSYYDCPDNMERFTYFSRAVLEFLLKSNRHPDVLHSHDWSTGLIPVLYHEIYKGLGLNIKKNIFTIHNLSHQGLSEGWIIDALGLSSSHLRHFDRLQDETFPHLLNILKGAIVYADNCTTVSPSYAEEIQTVEGGCGLNRLLNFYSYKLVGILNGIDYSYWNPEIDPLISHQYSPANKDLFFKNKALCKEYLKKRLNLMEGNKPLIGIVSRLVHQKGLDLIVQALHRTVDRGGQFILMGSSPDTPWTLERFKHLQESMLPTHQVHIELKHNESLAHQIFAGCDAFIIPSLFEPCGLTQQISLKYGTLPIARRTGGLADTVFDIDTAPDQKISNGFTFDHPTIEGVNWGIDRALKTFINKNLLWRKLMLKAATLDLSWHIPASHYLQLYGDR